MSVSLDLEFLERTADVNDARMMAELGEREYYTVRCIG